MGGKTFGFAGRPDIWGPEKDTFGVKRMNG